jgi:hypothetical protein
MALSQARLRELLHYDPRTGRFTWRVERTGRARIGAQAGTLRRDGYRQLSIDGKRYVAAPLVFLWMTGRFPPKMVDHINGKRADDRWCNLRRASMAQNAANRMSRTPFKGAYWHKGAYVGQIKADGKRIYLGRFKTARAAHLAYLAAARKHFGEFARAR